MIAFTRAVPDSLEYCELTHQQRVPIDLARARAEHELYEAALQRIGCQVVRLPEAHDLPDSVFVEDTAFVVDECAVLARPGAESRRAEVAAVRAALERERELFEITAPGTLDGGDVLRVGRRVFVGISTRTNAVGAQQLKEILERCGYTVESVEVTGLLHLKSTATAIDDRIVVANQHAPSLAGVELLRVPSAEAAAANVLWIGDSVLCPANTPQTAELLASRGLRVFPVPNSELAKAEAGLTCCSILCA